MGESISFELPKKEARLLVKIVLLYLPHESLNLHFFLLDQIVERHLHPHEHGVNVSPSFLNSHVLLTI